jgi:hypothetical protein
MRIGDRVRLLRGTEEGYIVSIKGNIVEIEIEEGFTIPAVRNEIVLIDKKESEAFRKEEVQEDEPVSKPPRQSSIGEGIYLGIGASEEGLQCAMINQTNNLALFSVSVIEKKNVRGLFHGICERYHALSLGKLDTNPDKETVQLAVQVILHEDAGKIKALPLDKVLTLAKSQFKSKIHVQSLDKDFTLIRLDGTETFDIDPIKIRDQMTKASPQTSKIKDASLKGKDQVVDLHVEPVSLHLNEKEVLQYQLELFEKSFDDALVSNARQLKIIHGIGTGVLRNEIHKRLSRRKEVKYYEDADKERFGFGSTIIYF